MSNFIKSHPVGADLFHAEGRTDRHDEANCRLWHLANAPEEQTAPFPAVTTCVLSLIFLRHFDPIPGRGLSFTGLRDHSQTQHSVGVPWNSDHPDAETHAIITTNRHRCNSC
jgi:hypothetical protein